MKRTYQFQALTVIGIIFMALSCMPALARISAEGAFQGGLQAFESGNLSESMTRWDQAIWYAIDEKQQKGWAMTASDYQIGALAYFYRGLTFQKLNQPGLAIADFARAERWSNGMSDIQLQIAAQYFRQDLYDETIRVCQNVLINDPNNAQAHYYLGYVYYKRSDFPLGMEHAQKAKAAGYPFADILLEKLQGTDSNRKNTANQDEVKDELPSVFLALASKYYQEGDYQKSIDICRKVLQSEPDNGQAHYYLGYSFYALHDYEKALEHARLARELGVTYADLLIEKLHGLK